MIRLPNAQAPTCAARGALGMAGARPTARRRRGGGRRGWSWRGWSRVHARSAPGPSRCGSPGMATPQGTRPRERARQRPRLGPDSSGSAWCAGFPRARASGWGIPAPARARVAPHRGGAHGPTPPPRGGPRSGGTPRDESGVTTDMPLTPPPRGACETHRWSIETPLHACRDSRPRESLTGDRQPTVRRFTPGVCGLDPLVGRLDSPAATSFQAAQGRLLAGPRAGALFHEEHGRTPCPRGAWGWSTAG